MSDLIKSNKHTSFACQTEFKTPFLETGLVTGGQHGSDSGCQPYTFRHCEHHVTGPYPGCTGEGPTPECQQQCRDGGYFLIFKENVVFFRDNVIYILY